MAASDKTEKATPKKRSDAREKGQVARSVDLGGAGVLLAAVFVIGWAGGNVISRMQKTMTDALVAIADPDVVSREGIGALLGDALLQVGLSVAPIAVACTAVALLLGVAQVGPRPMPGAVKPQWARINPVNNAKNLFGPNMLAEAVKSVSKVAIVAVIVFAAVAPRLPQLAARVGLSPIEFASSLVSDIHGLAVRASFAYLLIGLADLAWQRYRHEKQLRMDHQEIKEEMKGQGMPAEIRSALRRKQIQAARARMMADVPGADVIITNPTHFSVALKYEAGQAAPIVVAKGQDLLALHIRELAHEAGVPVLPSPPLARGLYASVDVGQQIPEEFFAAVAQILAHVYRQAGRRG